MEKTFLEYRRALRSKGFFFAVYTWTPSKIPTWHGFSYTGCHSDVPVGSRKTTTVPPAFHSFGGLLQPRSLIFAQCFPFSCNSLEIPNKALRSLDLNNNLSKLLRLCEDLHKAKCDFLLVAGRAVAVLFFHHFCLSMVRVSPSFSREQHNSGVVQQRLGGRRGRRHPADLFGLRHGRSSLRRVALDRQTGDQAASGSGLRGPRRYRVTQSGLRRASQLWGDSCGEGAGRHVHALSV